MPYFGAWVPFKIIDSSGNATKPKRWWWTILLDAGFEFMVVTFFVSGRLDRRMIESCKFMLGGSTGGHELFMLSLTTSRPVSGKFFEINIKVVRSVRVGSCLRHAAFQSCCRNIAGSSQLYMGLLRINSENVGGASPLLHVLLGDRWRIWDVL